MTFGLMLIMRKIFTLLLLLISVHSFGIDKHKLKDMPISRWKEITRMKPDSSLVAYTDTLFIAFRRRDSFQYHNGYSFIYNGLYSISDDSILDFGYSQYKLVEKTRDSLVIANDKGIFYLGPDKSDTVKVIVLDTAEKILPVASIDQMIGHWTVYKRTTKDTGTTLDGDKVVRAVYITGASTDGKLGYILGGKDPSSQPSWYIRSFGSDQTLDCEGKGARTMTVKKCQKGEMIIVEGDVTYYLKQFK